MLLSLESESTSDLSLTGDSGIPGSEPEVKDNREEVESESSNNGICCGAGNRAPVDDSETMEPESETNNNDSESERSGNGVCRRAENSSEDSEALILELGSDNDKLETDSGHSRYKKHCEVEYGVFSDSCFHSQK